MIDLSTNIIIFSPKVYTLGQIVFALFVCCLTQNLAYAQPLQLQRQFHALKKWPLFYGN